MIIPKVKRLVLPAILAGLLAGCATTSMYDQQAYAYQVQAKVAADHLIAKAVGSYDAVAVEKAQTALDVAYEFDAHRPLNIDTLKQWLLLRDRFSKFTTQWQAEGPRSSILVREKRAIISKGFDMLLATEANKIHGTP